MVSQAVGPEGRGLPLNPAKATRSKPAGMRRKEDTKKGPVRGKTSFIATIEVPQKKKGETSTAVSVIVSIKLLVAVSPFSVDDNWMSGASRLGSDTRHSKSRSVATQLRSSSSSSSSSTGCDGDGDDSSSNSAFLLLLVEHLEMKLACLLLLLLL